MYVVTSIPLVSRTRATLRSAEFGFFGVVVYTRVQTPRRCGAATFFLRPLPDFRPGVESFFLGTLRPLRTSWEVVGMRAVMLATLGGPQRAAGTGLIARPERRLPSAAGYVMRYEPPGRCVIVRWKEWRPSIARRAMRFQAPPLTWRWSATIFCPGPRRRRP